MRMTEAEFENERRYQMLMYHVKRMLRSGIISEEEFLEIDTRYRQKYQWYCIKCQRYDFNWWHHGNVCR